MDNDIIGSNFETMSSHRVAWAKRRDKSLNQGVDARGGLYRFDGNAHFPQTI